jgi:hypothetical protein
MSAPYATRDRHTFVLPDGWVPDLAASWCRSCNALILWCQTRSGKRAPLNPDGTSHFASCPQASTWRRRP